MGISDWGSDVCSSDLRLRQGAIDFRERFRPHWDKRWFRWIATGLGGLILAYALFWLVFARGLPDAATLLNYEPPLPTIVRDTNGQPVHSYARERRVQLQYSDYPPLLIRAYLSAEDKTFFEHHGVDIPDFIGAVFNYATKLGRSEEHTSELQSLMRTSYAVFFLKKQ